MERRLLAALAARKPDPVATEALVDVLWPEGAPRSAHKTLQTNVLRLRTLLGGSAILTTEHGYRLADDVDVDADRFELAVEAARAFGDWDAPLALSSGVPFEELAAWPPAEARRARIEELHRSVLEYRLEALLEGGASETLVPELEALVRAEPLREQRWCLLVRALDGAGRRAEALRAVERARGVFIAELGIEPGRELSALYQSLLIEHAPSDGEPVRGGEAIILSDRRYADATAARERGDLRAAVLAYCSSAQLARVVGDPRRLARAALGAAGDGWTTGLDATDEVVSLLLDAIALVPTGPTPTRSKLLSRLAVAQSHHRSMDDGERDAQAALAIARALDEPELEAGALHALVVVVEDPTRLVDQRSWVDALLRLADDQPDQPWRRWALQLAGHLAAREGDTSRALSLLDELGQAAVASGDSVAIYAASFRDLLAASIEGDWVKAREAVAMICAAGEAALFDPTAARLGALGSFGIIDLFDGTPFAPAPPVIEWPRPSMAFAIRAWHADGLARNGDVEAAAKALTDIVPADLFDLERDSYWLPTLGLLADAAHRADNTTISEALTELLEPVLPLTIVDAGCLYRGSVAHAAGLAAATCGRHVLATELLSDAAAVHDRQGSPWMCRESRVALDAVRAVR
jgi:DNA-binding SARP family transcriptional activator